MIDLRHLRSLLAIADTGKMVQAAQRVHLTQSALSHQVRALETHYGTSLFQRTPRGLQFTAAGDRLLALAREVLPAVQSAERDLARLKSDLSGELRLVLECHTCFDWLTPVMDAFRHAWPEVEIDLVAGFHSDPWRLLREGDADLVIGGLPKNMRGLEAAPLFQFEILAVLPPDHPLLSKPFLTARDFRAQTLITYPVPETRIDLIRQVLAPAGTPFVRRTAELTVALMQLVASHRGLAALPSWGIQNYVAHGYVAARPITRKGLWSELHAVGRRATMGRPYTRDLVRIILETCAGALPGIRY